MLQFRRAIAGPGQAEVVAIAGPALGAQRLRIEGVHVLHVQLEPLGRLTGVADGPHAAVDLAQDGLGLGLRAALALHHLVVFHQLLAEAELFSQLIHDHLVGARLEQRIDHLLAPLQGAVGRRGRTGGFELGARRQQVYGAVRVELLRIRPGHGRHGRRRRRVGVDHHEQIELVHRPFHLESARLRVGGMTPVEDGFQVRILIDQIVLLKHAVDPARNSDAGLGHHGLAGKLLLHPLEVNTPYTAPVFPGTDRDAVIAGQRIRVRADVGGSLYVIVAAVDVGTATRNADVAKRQLQDAGSTHEGVADRVLRLAHAPDDGRGLVLRHGLGHLEHFGLGYAADFLYLVRRPLGH